MINNLNNYYIMIMKSKPIIIKSNITHIYQNGNKENILSMGIKSEETQVHIIECDKVQRARRHGIHNNRTKGNTYNRQIITYSFGDSSSPFQFLQFNLNL